MNTSRQRAQSHLLVKLKINDFRFTVTWPSIGEVRLDRDKLCPLERQRSLRYQLRPTPHLKKTNSNTSWGTFFTQAIRNDFNNNKELNQHTRSTNMRAAVLNFTQFRQLWARGIVAETFVHKGQMGRLYAVGGIKPTRTATHKSCGKHTFQNGNASVSQTFDISKSSFCTCPQAEGNEPRCHQFRWVITKRDD